MTNNEKTLFLFEDFPTFFYSKFAVTDLHLGELKILFSKTKQNKTKKRVAILVSRVLNQVKFT